MADQVGAGDIAVAAYREDGVWQVARLPTQLTGDLDALLRVLRQQPADAGVLGLVALVGDDYFAVVRVQGDRVRAMLSDVTAAEECDLAADIVDQLDIVVPEPLDETTDDEELAGEPGGDLAILADLGLSVLDLEALCDDPDTYPDEAVAEIAAKLGFGAQFRAAVSGSGRSR